MEMPEGWKKLKAVADFNHILTSKKCEDYILEAAALMAEMAEALEEITPKSGDRLTKESVIAHNVLIRFKEWK